MSNRAFKPLIKNAWYVAAWSHEIGDKPLARQILNQHVVLFRDADGQAGALEDRCCHRATPLSLGTIVAQGLQCGYHGMTFDRQGKCTLNPADDPGNLSVRSFPIVEQQKFIWIWMGDPALADPEQIVDFPYHDQREEWPFEFGHFNIKCNYMLVMDNLMDLTHLGYVHTKTIGGTPVHHDNASMETTETEYGSKFVRWMLNAPPPPTFVKAAGFTGNIDRWSMFEYVAPGTVRQFGGGLDIGRGAQNNQNQDGALRLRLYHGATPETETTCHYFWSIAHGFGESQQEITKIIYGDIVPTFLEDIGILEAQQQTMQREPNRPFVIRKHDRAVALAHKGLDRFADASEQAAPKGIAAE